MSHLFKLGLSDVDRGWDRCLALLPAQLALHLRLNLRNLEVRLANYSGQIAIYNLQHQAHTFTRVDKLSGPQSYS
jgi:hypothetical protein